jgi:hypothetical protein
MEADKIAPTKTATPAGGETPQLAFGTIREITSAVKSLVEAKAT